MTSLDEELVASQKHIDSLPSGPQILSETENFASFLTTYVYDCVEGASAPLSSISLPFGASAKMILSMIGPKGLHELLYKNILLVLGRLFNATRAYDDLPLQDKLPVVVSFLQAITTHSQAWDLHLGASFQETHDKKERLKRRHALKHTDPIASHTSAITLLNTIYRHLLPITLPNGAASLYLPPGGAMFHSWINEALKKEIVTEQIAHSVDQYLRQIKVNGLYQLLTNIRNHLLVFSLQQVQRKFPETLPDAIEPLLPLAKVFAPGAVSTEDSLPTTASANAVANCLLGVIDLYPPSFLISAGYLEIVHGLSKGFSVRSESDLELLIEQLSHSEQLAKTAIHLCTQQPDISPSLNVDPLSSVWGMVLHGLTSSVREFLTQDTLDSYEWEATQKSILDRVHWFILSPYFDQAVIKWISRS